MFLKENPHIKKDNDVLQQSKSLKIATFILYLICLALFISILIVGILLSANGQSSEQESAGFATIAISGFFSLIFVILTYQIVKILKPKDQKILLNSITSCLALFLASLFFCFGLSMVNIFMFASYPSTYGVVLFALECLLVATSIAGVVISSITRRKVTKLVHKETRKIIASSPMAHNDFAYSDTMSENRRLKQELAELENAELKKKIEEIKSKKK